MAIIDKDWGKPEDHYGITRKRAIELGEDADYPRISAAVFHFDKLTPEEQQTVIKYKKEELVEALDDRKQIYADSKKSAQTSRALHIDPRNMNPFPGKKKQVKERIEMLQKSVDRLTDSAKTVKTKQKPLRDMTKTELKKLRVILHILPDGTMEIKEKGVNSLERGVASWNPPNRPDMTERSRMGGYIMNENVADNAKKWLDRVANKYDLDMDEIVADSWRGGGMRHKESPYSSTTNTFTGKAKTVSGSKVTTKERPNLSNVVGLHPSNKSWRNFLKDAELREEKNGIKHYIFSNGHYIVLPDGEVITFYGYHGQNAFDKIVADKAGWLRERDKAEKELDELLHPDELAITATQMGLTNKQLEQARKEGVTTALGLRRIEKNTRGASKATDLQAIHDARSPRSRESDERLSNADTIEPDDPRVEQWVRDQGRLDVVGIDTPSRKRKIKSPPKRRLRSMRTETQVRSLRGKR